MADALPLIMMFDMLKRPTDDLTKVWYVKRGKRMIKVIRYCSVCNGSYHVDDHDPGCECRAPFLPPTIKESY